MAWNGEIRVSDASARVYSSDNTIARSRAALACFISISFDPAATHPFLVVEIINAVVVHLDRRGTDHNLAARTKLLRLFKEKSAAPWEKALGIGRAFLGKARLSDAGLVAHDRVRFPRAGLPISKDGSRIPVESK